jgi:hypothetical protein
VSSGIHGAVVLSLSGVALAGCTAMLGIDGEYVQENRVGATGGAASLSGGGSSTGGAGSGGITDSDVKPASGGESLATGGTAPVNDAEVPQCTAGTDECGNGMKCCLGTCVPAEPLSGCSALACDPCPRPPDVAVAICDDGRCANKCNDGYRLVGDQSATQVCEVIATNTGGAPGNGGASNGGAAATGGTPPCVPEECPATGHRCLNPLQGWLHCCKNDNTCGCTWAPELPRADLPAPYCL